MRSLHDKAQYEPSRPLIANEAPATGAVGSGGINPWHMMPTTLDIKKINSNREAPIRCSAIAPNTNRAVVFGSKCHHPPCGNTQVRYCMNATGNRPRDDAEP